MAAVHQLGPPLIYYFFFLDMAGEGDSIPWSYGIYINQCSTLNTHLTQPIVGFNKQTKNTKLPSLALHLWSLDRIISQRESLPACHLCECLISLGLSCQAN